MTSLRLSVMEMPEKATSARFATTAPSMPAQS